jgi:Na+/H+ antiporter NhaA
VVVGLVIGKLVGVAGAIALVVRFGGGRLPPGITQRHILGMAGVAGIGFTVSIFVAGLAFEHPDLTDQAKIGVLASTILAACLGAAILLRRETTLREPVPDPAPLTKE